MNLPQTLPLDVNMSVNASANASVNAQLFTFSAPPGRSLIDRDRTITCEKIICGICQFSGNRQDDCDFIYHRTKVFRTTVTTPCCQSILCPKCVHVNRDQKTIQFQFLTICNVVYLQPSETFEFEVFPNDCSCTDDIEIQEQWYVVKPMQTSQLSKYTVVDLAYNSCDTTKIHTLARLSTCTPHTSSTQEYVEYIDYSDVRAQCICRSCGFTCTAMNYMNS